MPGVSGVTVVTNACAFYTTHAAAGRIERPAFPAPSDLRGQDFPRQNSRELRGEIVGLCLRVTWLFEIESPVSASFLHPSHGERSRASCERVRGYSLTIDRNPNPLPTGEGVHFRRCSPVATRTAIAATPSLTLPHKGGGNKQRRLFEN
jgi:hypothetical protein